MTTRETLHGIVYIVKWHNTGEEVDRVDCYDWAEFAEGEDQFGGVWQGIATMSLNEIIEIEEPSLLK